VAWLKPKAIWRFVVLYRKNKILIGHFPRCGATLDFGA
jgi:hypothetical protein